MKTALTRLLSVPVVGLLLAAGCAGHDREALHQPMERNYANPADPLERQLEGQDALDPRGRIEAPLHTVPEVDDEPPEAVDPDERGIDRGAAPGAAGV